MAEVTFVVCVNRIPIIPRSQLEKTNLPVFLFQSQSVGFRGYFNLKLTKEGKQYVIHRLGDKNF